MQEEFRMIKERKANASRPNRQENLSKRSYFTTIPQPKFAVLPFEFPRSTQPDTWPINFSTSQQSTFRHFLFLLHGSLRSFVPTRRGFVHSECPGAPLSRPPSLQKWIKSHRLGLIVGHARSVAEYFHPQQKWFQQFSFVNSFDAKNFIVVLFITQ